MRFFCRLLDGCNVRVSSRLAAHSATPDKSSSAVVLETSALTYTHTSRIQQLCLWGLSSVVFNGFVLNGMSVVQCLALCVSWI